MKKFPGRRTRVLAATTATAGLALVAVTASGCTSSGNGGSGSKTAAGGVELVKAGQLTTCTHLPYPPFQSDDDGKVSGFDVDIDRPGRQEARRQPADRRHAVRDYQDRPRLNSGKCDVAAAGMTITAERKSSSTSPSPTSTPPRRSWPRRARGITSLADLEGQEAQARRPGRRPPARTTCKRKGFDPVLRDSDAVLNGLRTGQVNAVINDYPVVQGWLKDQANADVRARGQPQHR